MIQTEEIEGAPRNDFRRANGAPMWIDRDGKNQRGSRPSGWGKILDDENALVNWKLDREGIGVAGDPALIAAYQAVKIDDRKKLAELREKAINAGRGDEAADIGTALHAMTERMEDPTDDFVPPEQYRESLVAYMEGLQLWDLFSERVEFPIVNEEYRAAGTCDRLYRLGVPLETPRGVMLPAGTLVAGDVKTGKKLDFSMPGYAVQMAIYAQGEFYDVAEDRFMPTPEINTDWGILIHIPANQPGVVEFLWVDLEVGNYGAWMVSEVREWRKNWRNGMYGCPPLQASVTNMLERSVQVDDEASRAFARRRLDVIKTHDKARHRLLFTWPEGLSPAKTADSDELVRIHEHLDFIEREFELPFLEGDHRIVPGKKSDD